jgi:hypothetical protein
MEYLTLHSLEIEISPAVSVEEFEIRRGDSIAWCSL